MRAVFLKIAQFLGLSQPCEPVCTVQPYELREYRLERLYEAEKRWEQHATRMAILRGSDSWATRFAVTQLGKAADSILELNGTPKFKPVDEWAHNYGSYQLHQYQ